MKRDLEALLSFIESRQNAPYKWGRKNHDCVSFVAQALKAETKHHRLGKLNWSTQAGAVKAIKKEGGLEKALDKRFQRIAPAHAMRGDIAGVPDADFGIHPAIVEGDTLVLPGGNGLRRVPRKAMTCAWSAVLPKPKG